MSYRRFKTTAPKTPVKTDNFGWPLCRQCESPVMKKGQTFCSNACIYEWRIRTDCVFMREQVFKRDKGICKKCGVDCQALRRALIKKPKDCFMVHSQWEAHHLKGVAEGGGECGLNNYETLCFSCHSKETKIQRMKRDSAKRFQREMQILRFIHDEFFGASTQEIINGVQMSKSNVGEYLKDLKERNYISQSKRGAPFFITKEGMDVLKKA